MTPKSPTALVVDDEKPARDLLAELVESEGFSVTSAGSLAQARAAIRDANFDVVLTDLMLPDGNGLSLLQEMNKDAQADIVFITGKASVDTVVEAFRKGASDYLTKPVDVARLKAILANVAKSRAATRASSSPLSKASAGAFGSLRGRSTAMLGLYKHIQKVAATDVTVLVTGETGAGKEVVAATIHELGSRASEPFVPINCGAISETLIESELFGHEQGSFTGANRRHAGVFERADRGTLFLDEITEMPMSLQVKLLRVLETRSFHRIGGETPVKTDTRVIAASNRPPEDAVRDGKLREDLFYRLQVFPIQLPPLRDRDGDVEFLSRHFLDQANAETGKSKRLTDEALSRLTAHRWPGNVRELKNVISRAFILADETIDAKHIVLMERTEVSGDEVAIPVGTTIANAERRLILATMKKYNGNKNQVANVLGISLKTLYSRLNVYEAQDQGQGTPKEHGDLGAPK